MKILKLSNRLIAQKGFGRALDFWSVFFTNGGLGRGVRQRKLLYLTLS